MRKPIMATAAVVALGAAALVAGNTGAEETMAGPPDNARCVKTTGAKACFQASGDVVWVKDTKGDGHHTVGSLVVLDGSGPGKIHNCHNYKGSGTWKKCGYSEVRENKKVAFNAQRREGDIIPNASKDIPVRT